MTYRWPARRLLQVTIVAIGALLVLKSVAIVRAAAPAAAPALAADTEAGKPLPPPAAPPGDSPGAKSGTVKPVEAPSAAAATSTMPAHAEISDAERALLVDLRQRRAELDAREAGLAARENMLTSTEKRLTVRIDELTGLQARLEALEAARKQRDEANWSGLVKLYEGMKPRDAAVIFNELDMPVLLQVLDRMKEGKAAPVLAAMLPERARLVTSQLAQMRNKGNAAPGAAMQAPKTNG